MSTPARARLLEAGAVLLLLGVAGAVTAGPRVLHGGYESDDWALASTIRFHGFSGLAHNLLDWLPRRPLNAVYYSAVFSLLGSHGVLAVALLSRLGVAWAFYLLLREATVDWVLATGAALLALLFPWSDSTLLWGAESSVNVAIWLWLVGALCALRSTRFEGRDRLALVVAAIALDTTAVMLEELVLPAVILSSVLFLARGPRRRAAPAAGAHLGIMVVVAVFVSLRVIPVLGGHPIHAAVGLGRASDHLGVIADQSLTLLGMAVVSGGHPHRTIVIGVLLALVVAAAVLIVRADAATRARFIRLTMILLGGVVLLCVGYAPFVPAADWYVPLQPGLGNRTNALAGLGFALLVVGSVGLAAELLLGRVRRATTVMKVVAAATICAVAVVYARHTRHSTRHWNEASAQAHMILATLRTLIPAPAPDSTILVGGFEQFVAPGLPVFVATWDLNGAVRLLWSRPRLTGLPVMPGALITCTGGLAVLSESVGSPVLAHPLRYANTYFVDITARSVTRLDDPGDCRQVASRL
ncbi:MAG: hypothetical protein ACYC91_17380 [Solirubrobacteraceae bacterium]